MRFITFLIIFFIGLGMIIYREKIQRVSGNFSFAEKYLGAGGTFTFYLFLGIFTIFISITYITGTWESFIQNTFGRFFISH